MPNIAVLDMAGNNVGEITLSDAIFGITPNAAVMHAAVINKVIMLCSFDIVA